MSSVSPYLPGNVTCLIGSCNLCAIGAPASTRTVLQPSHCRPAHPPASPETTVTPKSALTEPDRKHLWHPLVAYHRSQFQWLLQMQPGRATGGSSRPTRDEICLDTSSMPAQRRRVFQSPSQAHLAQRSADNIFKANCSSDRW